ncbi:MAG TPA: aminotransferase class I/II-fold pyridoxal phosphate-dependent enzyme [Candidatus Angelobacter sp.]|nr:aminotransferase class I/II-fold pyridoxal phosphate-dependent enzyme [Candidatus Angelobacter sp.]
MTTSASRVDRMRASVAPFLRFFSGPFEELNRAPDVANFAVGNPQELPLPAYVGALERALPPLDKDWFAYKLSEPGSQRIVAGALSARTGLAWDPDDVAMTNGGFAALAVTIRALVEPGDEVLFCSPPWFFYELLVLAAGGEPARVTLDPPAFDLDVDRIAAAVTPRTRAVIVNSPHNPSGRVFSAETFADLGRALTDASARAGRPVWIISDEPYRRIAFDGRDVPSPATAYPHTAITYSYGKQTLAPGQRIGYIAVPPTCPDRVELRDRIFLEQMATGYSWPNALLQHALADIEETVVDIGALQRRRDRLVPALRELGYEASMPEGTFYTMARAPIEDDAAFAELLARHRILVLPGSIVEVPGWFRVSLTASDEMVEMGIPRFAAARREATA